MAGGHDGAGGDGLHCNGGVFALFYYLDSSSQDRKISLADVDIDRSNWLPEDIFDFTSEDVVFESVLTYMDAHQPEDAKKVREAYSQLTFKEVSSIPKLDTGVNVGWTAIFGCSRTQLAVQDFSTNTVFFDKKQYENLNKLSQALLKLHESFIRIEHESTNDLKQMETEARAKVHAIFEAKDFNRAVVDEVFRRQSDPQLTKESAFSHYFVQDFSIDNFLSIGLDPNAKLNGCDDPLVELALERKRSVTVKNSTYDVADLPVDAALSLLKAGARVDMLDEYHRPFIFLALDRFHVAVQFDEDGGYYDVDKILEARPDINVNAPYCDGTQEGDVAETALDLYEKNKGVRELLLAHGAKTGAELGLKCHAVPAAKFVKNKCLQYLQAKD